MNPLVLIVRVVFEVGDSLLMHNNDVGKTVHGVHKLAHSFFVIFV